MKVQKITPFLWFDNVAVEAAIFYISIFKNSRIISSSPIVTKFELEGLELIALNGGPTFKLSEAFSLAINCNGQTEIDYYWDKLTSNGSEGRCGWLKDKFGVSWQVVPSILPKILSDPEKASRVTSAYMKMNKLDIELLMKA